MAMGRLITAAAALVVLALGASAARQSGEYSSAMQGLQTIQTLTRYIARPESTPRRSSLFRSFDMPSAFRHWAFSRRSQSLTFKHDDMFVGLPSRQWLPFHSCLLPACTVIAKFSALCTCRDRSWAEAVCKRRHNCLPSSRPGSFS